MAGEPVAIASGTNAYTRLMDPNRKWYNNRRRVLGLLLILVSLIALNTWILLLLITSSTNGYDGSMMNGLQSLPQWEGYFDHPTKGKLGLLNAIQNIGALAGYPFAPYMADGIGRKPTIFFGALIMVIANVHCFLVGFGLTFAVLVTKASLKKAKKLAPAVRVSAVSGTKDQIWVFKASDGDP
ncbi:hypothetical protein B0H14DRAFT_3593938 [Mycena olivaceomarginata]|nr:hypothetical protein B0H14DRAFT_3593938 [Mycena olivaceomarginata]